MGGTNETPENVIEQTPDTPGNDENGDGLPGGQTTATQDGSENPDGTVNAPGDILNI